MDENEVVEEAWDDVVDGDTEEKEGETEEEGEEHESEGGDKADDKDVDEDQND